MTGYPVREATSDDISRLRAIQLTALAEPWPELLAAAVDGPPVLLVYADPAPVGYALALAGKAASDTAAAGYRSGDGNGIGVDPVGSAASRGHATGDHDAYLVELAVAAPRRGEGCGSGLLSALAGRLRRDGYERLRVTVREADERAIAFYLDRGFTLEARLPDHYESGDGRVLVRRLDG